MFCSCRKTLPFQKIKHQVHKSAFQLKQYFSIPSASCAKGSSRICGITASTASSVGYRFQCCGRLKTESVQPRSKYENMSAQRKVVRFVSDNTSRPTFCKEFNIPGAIHLSPQNAYHWQCRVVTWCVTDSATDEPQHKDAAVVIQVLHPALTISRGPSANGRAAETILGAAKYCKRARNCRGQKSMREVRRHKQTLKYRSRNGQS